MAIKVMVVDDEPEILKLFKATVEPLGYEVLTLVDSREAAQRLKSEKFDGVFVDMKMPYMDGFELTRCARASPLNGTVPIVMLTAYDDLETMRKAFQVGITFFLGKPFTRERAFSLFGAMRGAMLKEKRRHARLPFRTVVNCMLGQKQFKAASLNISGSGILMEPSGGLEVGQEIGLEFAMPGAPRLLKPHAKVVRKEPPDRVGLKFSALEPADREAIQHYMLAGVKE